MSSGESTDKPGAKLELQGLLDDAEKQGAGFHQLDFTFVAGKRYVAKWIFVTGVQQANAFHVVESTGIGRENPQSLGSLRSVRPASAEGAG